VKLLDRPLPDPPRVRRAVGFAPQMLKEDEPETITGIAPPSTQLPIAPDADPVQYRGKR